MEQSLTDGVKKINRKYGVVFGGVAATACLRHAATANSSTPGMVRQASFPAMTLTANASTPGLNMPAREEEHGINASPRDCGG